MKKLLYLSVVLMLGMLLSACDDSTTDPPTVDQKGNILVKSNPLGAQIWVDGTNSGKVTTDTVKSLAVGTRSITLKLAGYPDTTFTVSVTANSTVTKDIYIKPVLTNYTAVRVYETAATGAGQLSGLSLKYGKAYSATVTYKDTVDLYYSSTNFKIRSSKLATGFTRETLMKNSNVVVANIQSDSTASAELTATNGVTEIGDRETNYFFAKDADGFYYRIGIGGFGGGTPGNPAYVDFNIVRNRVAGDKRFK